MNITDRQARERPVQEYLTACLPRATKAGASIWVFAFKELLWFYCRLVEGNPMKVIRPALRLAEQDLKKPE